MVSSINFLIPFDFIISLFCIHWVVVAMIQIFSLVLQNFWPHINISDNYAGVRLVKTFRSLAPRGLRASTLHFLIFIPAYKCFYYTIMASSDWRVLHGFVMITYIYQSCYMIAKTYTLGPSSSPVSIFHAENKPPLWPVNRVVMLWFTWMHSMRSPPTKIIFIYNYL